MNKNRYYVYSKKYAFLDEQNKFFSNVLKLLKIVRLKIQDAYCSYLKSISKVLNNFLLYFFIIITKVLHFPCDFIYWFLFWSWKDWDSIVNSQLPSLE